MVARSGAKAPEVPGKGIAGAFLFGREVNRMQQLRSGPSKRALATVPQVERYYVPDEAAMLNALRIALGLQKRPFGQEA